MGTISGAHLVAKALKAEGVQAIFTLCGGHIIDIYDGCPDEGIRIIDVRHEQAAAHAADAWKNVLHISPSFQVHSTVTGRLRI
jgi:acetolactate synthase-1/2/3 large subunit